jgi:DNA-binding XRE family transcriptional regulator
MLSSDENRVIEKIQFYRKRAKKTQEELANELNISRTILVAIEKGERKLRADELVKISQIQRSSPI